MRLDLACVDAALRSGRALPKETLLFVNIQAGTMSLDSRALFSLMDALEVDPKRVVLEISESVDVERTRAIGRRLAPFRRRGVRLALDDVGVRYPWLHHLSLPRARVDQGGSVVREERPPEPPQGGAPRRPVRPRRPSRRVRHRRGHRDRGGRAFDRRARRPVRAGLPSREARAGGGLARRAGAPDSLAAAGRSAPRPRAAPSPVRCALPYPPSK